MFQVAHKFMVMHPVEGFGIVGTQFDGNNVGFKSQGIEKHLLLHVGAVALIEQGAAAESVIAHFVTGSEHLPQQTRIAVALLIVNGCPLGDAVAHTGHFDGFLCLQGQTCPQQQAQNKNFSFH